MVGDSLEKYLIEKPYFNFVFSFQRSKLDFHFFDLSPGRKRQNIDMIIFVDKEMSGIAHFDMRTKRVERDFMSRWIGNICGKKQWKTGEKDKPER
jgi:hypothetical protein